MRCFTRPAPSGGNGLAGTSQTGKKHYYYKCGSAKRKTGCTKKAVKKDWIENLVITETMGIVFNDEAMEKLADVLIEFQRRENTDIPILLVQLEETARGIENLLNAIQQGILTTSTKARLEQLEETKAQLEISIAQAELEKPLLTRQQILFWLHRFRGIDISKQAERQRLVDSFVNAVYVYDDKIILTFNYREGTKTITLDDIKGSDLGGESPPKAKGPDSLSENPGLYSCHLAGALVFGECLCADR